jgi:hypothetical protein
MLWNRFGKKAQHSPNDGRHGAKKPDVADTTGQFDMPHSIPANNRMNHFDSAAITNNALVPYLPVFSAAAFPIPGGSESFLT